MLNCHLSSITWYFLIKSLKMHQYTLDIAKIPWWTTQLVCRFRVPVGFSQPKIAPTNQRFLGVPPRILLIHPVASKSSWRWLSGKAPSWAAKSTGAPKFPSCGSKRGVVFLHGMAGFLFQRKKTRPFLFPVSNHLCFGAGNLGTEKTKPKLKLELCPKKLAD